MSVRAFSARLDYGWLLVTRMEDEIKKLLQSPSAWLSTLALGIFVGIWWASMTPTKTNVSLVIAVLASVAAVWFNERLASEHVGVRIASSVAAACVLGLLVYYFAWERPKPLSEQVVSVDNIESKVEQWLNDLRIPQWKWSKVEEVSFFTIEARLRSGVVILIGRPKGSPNVLSLQSPVIRRPDERQLFSRLTPQERPLVLEAVYLRIASSNFEIGVTDHGHWVASTTLVIAPTFSSSDLLAGLIKTENTVNIANRAMVEETAKALATRKK